MPCLDARASRRRFAAAATIAVVIAVAIAGTIRGATAQPPVLRVAAASDLQAVFPELARRFTADTGIRVTASFGSSGSFFAQIGNGAPYDLFFSADIDYPRQLAAAGLGEADSLYTYATGHIVLWTRRDSGIDVRRGLDVLRDPRVRRIAIANPLHAPYGRAAVAALRGAGVYGTVRQKIVLGENVSQTAQLADSGNADVAILAMSLARGSALQRSGVYSEIPPSSHPPIEQAAIVVRGAANADAARRFLAFLRSEPARALLRQAGFVPPDGER